MRAIVCPDVAWSESANINDRYVFVAGGITGCSNWQNEFINKFEGVEGITLLNPRRPFFDVRDPSMSDAQIEWEHRHLHFADAISFWFPPETLCPITLFELGKCLGQKRQVFVGTDPNYQRRLDVVKQTSLLDPSVVVHNNMDDLVADVTRWVAFQRG